PHTDLLHPIAMVGDRQHIAGPQPTGADPPAVDPCPVGAAQIAYPDLAVLLRQAAVPARDPERVEPGVTIRMATDDNQRTIQADRGPSGRSDQATGHGDGSWKGRALGPRTARGRCVSDASVGYGSARGPVGGRR